MLKLTTINIDGTSREREMDPDVVSMAFRVGPELVTAGLAPQAAQIAFITDNAYGMSIIFAENRTSTGAATLLGIVESKGRMKAVELTPAVLDEEGLLLSRLHFNQALMHLTRKPEQQAAVA